MAKRSIFPHSLNVLSIIHIVFLDTDTDKLIIKLTWNDIASVAQKDQHMNFIAVLFIYVTKYKQTEKHHYCTGSEGNESKNLGDSVLSKKVIS